MATNAGCGPGSNKKKIIKESHSNRLAAALLAGRGTDGRATETLGFFSVYVFWVCSHVVTMETHKCRPSWADRGKFLAPPSATHK
jgi:hypothetical protein